MILSVIIPVYNEAEDIERIIAAVEAVDIPKQIIVVDDCSTDGTREKLLKKKHIHTIFHDMNQGKGAAIRSALKNATGEITIIQDADLEYSPEQYHQLLRKMAANDLKVVYGSRILGRGRFLMMSYLANRILTLLTNLLFRCHLTDMETCYKMIDTQILKQLNLVSSRFEIEPEITCKILKRGARIVEIPISYQGRRKGKKIGVHDGIQAVWNLIKWKFKR